jgi:MFS family permease
LTSCITYLQKVFAIDRSLANQLGAIPLVGVVIGSYGGGVLADRVLAATGSKRWSRNGVAVGTAAIGIGFFVLAWCVQAGPYVAIALLFLAAVFSSGGHPCSYTVSIDIGGKYLVIVFGALNMLGNFGSGFLPQIVVPWKDTFGWAAVPLLVGLGFLLGSICWLFVNPNGLVLEGPEQRNKER